MNSQLQRISSNYVRDTGTRFALDHGGVTTVIAARQWPVKAASKVANVGGNVFFAAKNVYEFLTPFDNAAADGDIVTKYSAGIVGSEQFFLYLLNEHEVSEAESHKKFFSVRINVTGLSFTRKSEAAGEAGGITNAMVAVAGATSVLGHFWEGSEGINFSGDLKTEKFAGSLVIQKSYGIEVQDQFSVNSKNYEILGFDNLAIDGLVVCAVGRVK